LQAPAGLLLGLPPGLTPVPTWTWQPVPWGCGEFGRTAAAGGCPDAPGREGHVAGAVSKSTRGRQHSRRALGSIPGALELCEASPLVLNSPPQFPSGVLTAAACWAPGLPVAVPGAVESKPQLEAPAAGDCKPDPTALLTASAHGGTTRSCHRRLRRRRPAFYGMLAEVVDPVLCCNSKREQSSSESDSRESVKSVASTFGGSGLEYPLFFGNGAGTVCGGASSSGTRPERAPKASSSRRCSQAQPLTKLEDKALPVMKDEDKDLLELLCRRPTGLRRQVSGLAASHADFGLLACKKEEPGAELRDAQAGAVCKSEAKERAARRSRRRSRSRQRQAPGALMAAKAEGSAHVQEPPTAAPDVAPAAAPAAALAAVKVRGAQEASTPSLAAAEGASCKDDPSAAPAERPLPRRRRRSRSRRAPGFPGKAKRERRVRRLAGEEFAAAVEPPLDCKEEPAEPAMPKLEEWPQRACSSDAKQEVKAEDFAGEDGGLAADAESRAGEVGSDEDDGDCTSSEASTSVGSVRDCTWGPKEEDPSGDDLGGRGVSKDMEVDDVPEYTNEELGLLLLKPARDGNLRKASRFMIRLAGRRGGSVLRKRIPGDIVQRLATIMPAVSDLRYQSS